MPRQLRKIQAFPEMPDFCKCLQHLYLTTYKLSVFIESAFFSNERAHKCNQTFLFLLQNLE